MLLNTEVRIGPKKYGYIYKLVGPDRSTLVCTRASVYAEKKDMRLYLTIEDGLWVAKDALNEDDKSAIPVFRTDSDALEEGWHWWEGNMSRDKDKPVWEDVGWFQTTYLD